MKEITCGGSIFDYDKLLCSFSFDWLNIMAKICEVCGKKLGLFEVKHQMKDAVICSNCLKSAGIDLVDCVEYLNDVLGILQETPLSDLDEARENIALYVRKRKEFSATYCVGDYAQFDDTHRTMLLIKEPSVSRIPSNYTLVPYGDVIDFELLEDGTSVVSGGLGRSVVGGILFGPTGAIVGGVTGKKKGKDVCNLLQIKVTTSNQISPAVFSKLIAAETKKKGFVYRTAYQSAQKIISKLQSIVVEMESISIEAETNSVIPVDPVNEIRRYKELLDDGLLTQAEFDAKKRQLLGI